MAAKDNAEAKVVSSVAPPEVSENRDGTVSLKYRPTEKGCHTVQVHHNQKSVIGSPYKFFVETVPGGYITLYGAGLTGGRCNEAVKFNVTLKGVNKNDLKFSVDGPSSPTISLVENRDDSLAATYNPTAPGNYDISVSHKGTPLPGSPYHAHIQGEAMRRQQVAVASRSLMSLKVKEENIEDLTAVIQTPSGVDEPCVLKLMPSMELGIVLNPHEDGPYAVTVTRNGKPINKSPFKFNISKEQVRDAKKVVVDGAGVKQGQTGQVNKFTVNPSKAGYGVVSVAMEGASKPEIEVKDPLEGPIEFGYRVSQPGNYSLSVRYSGEHVNGSPFIVKVGGQAKPKQSTVVAEKCPPLHDIDPGVRGQLTFRFPQMSLLDMSASITDPTGKSEALGVVDLGTNHYRIDFVGKEAGVYAVSIKHKGMHITGSPFPFTIGPRVVGGAVKVRAFGVGLEHGQVRSKNEFEVYWREAGAGDLTVNVEGPSKPEVQLEQRQDGTYGITYRCAEPGEYSVSVKFNDDDIPESPFTVHITPETEANKLTVSSLQDKGLQVGKPVTFMVNYNGAKGKLTSKVEAPSGGDEEGGVSEIDPNEKYMVRFTPRENGPHLCHVLLDSQPIPGSPFWMLVGKYDADPGVVHASGEGLVSAEADKRSTFHVNTVNGGTGTILVSIDGPSKVPISFSEDENGYEFSYTPKTPGDYLVAIKYGGNFHICGSPFKVQAGGKGKPGPTREHSVVSFETTTKLGAKGGVQMTRVANSKPENVRCKGQGIKKAFMGKQCNFTVEVREAGTNSLQVGFLGPDTMNEEVSVKRTSKFQYSVNYTIREKGHVTLFVKWGDDHVPGSPFVIQVA